MRRLPAFYDPTLDKKIRPQDDFYRYANDAWIKANPIPASHAIWRSSDTLTDAVQFRLKAILERLAKSRTRDADATKLRAYYATGMDERLAERLGAKPLAGDLARVAALEDRAKLPALIARFHNMGIPAFWDWYVGPDLKRNDETIFEVNQDGLGLPDRDYYLKGDAKSRKVRAEYAKAVARLMRLAGWPARDAASAAKAVLRIEKALAEASMSRVELRNFHAQYNKMSPAALTKVAPGVDWRAYVAAVGVRPAHARKIIVCQPKFMKAAAAIVAKAPLADIRTYLSWHLVANAAPYLNDAFVRAHFAFFGKVLSGKKEIRPCWKRVINELDGHVGFLLGKQYVKEHFPESAKRRIDALIDDLFAAYRARMTTLPWMSVDTMAKAIEKLDAMRRKIGYPKKWRSYAAFRPDASSYLAMHRAGVRFHVRRALGKLGKPVDRSEWGMKPHEVNAYCSFIFNEIVFPAGILQKPFFDASWDDALNYGGIGAVIGHELTHAFDDKGAGFDKTGNLKNWWKKSDKRKFDAAARRVVAQYGEHVVIDGMRCNGALTVGENIADIGGLAIAFEALGRRLGSRLDEKAGEFTHAQRFFIAYAQTWAGSTRPAEARRRVMTDPHAPSELRVNVALPNLQAFHDAFGIRPGDKMYRKPADRVGIW